MSARQTGAKWRTARVGGRRPAKGALGVLLTMVLVIVAGAAPAMSGPLPPRPSRATASPAPPTATEPLYAVERGQRAATDVGAQPVEPLATAAAAQFVPLEPERIVDTRYDLPGPLVGGDVLTFYPQAGLPMGVTAVAFDIVATGQTASGYLEVAPAGAPPGSSTVNWSGLQQTIANGHVTRVSPDREFQVSLTSTGTAHVVLDVTGYFAPAGTTGATLYTPTDRRIYDSRISDGPLEPGEYRYIDVNTGVVSPAVAPTAAAINVTATGTTGSGVFSAAGWPTTETSTINWSGGAQTIANAVITDVWIDGLFTVTNNGQTPAHLVVDLTGLFAPTAMGAVGAQFYAMDPVRSYDSRSVDGPLVAGTSRANVHPVPVGAVAVALNTTITGTSGTGYISVTPPAAVLPPATSTVNWFNSPTTRANGSMVQVANATTRAYVGGSYSAQYLYDVAGYFQ